MGRAKRTIDEAKLSNWKLLDVFRQRLAQAQQSRDRGAPEERKRPGGPERLLLENHYFSLMLFGLFNPIVDSMRGLCAASHLRRVQKEVCGRPVSLGSFSEAQSIFDPELLKEVFLGLCNEVPQSWGDPRLAHLADKLHLVDGTLLPALPRMHWALWLDGKNHAAKLHLKFSVLRQAASEALLTAGNCCERKTLRKFVNPGNIIVADRYYGLHYAFLNEMRNMDTSFVLRLRNKPRMEICEEMALTKQTAPQA